MNSFLFFFIFTIIGLFLTESIFADDKGETKNKNFHIKVIIDNPGRPITDDLKKKDKWEYNCKDSKALNFSNTGIHKQSLCIYLKDIDNIENDQYEKDLVEDKNIKLDDNNNRYSIIRRGSMSNLSKDKKIIFEYQRRQIDLLLELSNKQILNNSERQFNIILSTLSKENINISKNIVDAYVIVSDLYGNILKKEDLYDKNRNIDFLELDKIKKFDIKYPQKMIKNIIVSNKEGKYLVELGIILKPNFLNLSEDFSKKYLIEIRSNKVQVNLSKNEDKNTLNSIQLLDKTIIGTAIGGVFIGWLIFLLFFRRRLYRLILKFIVANIDSVEMIKNSDEIILKKLVSYIKSKMFNLVSKRQILKILKQVLNNEF